MNTTDTEGRSFVEKKSPMRLRQEKMNLLRNSIRKMYSRFLKIRGRPRQIALGLALGLFIGMTPTLGIQMAVALFAASVFKWNKISAALGVWITNPLTAPFIYGLTYIVGKKVLGIAHSPELSGDFYVGAFHTILNKAPEIFGALMVGGVVLGLPLAVLGYFVSYSLLVRYQEKIKNRIKVRGKRMAQRIKTRKKQEN